MSNAGSIVAEIKQQLDALMGTSIPVSLGVLNLAQNDAPPRVVFVPTDILYAGAQGPGIGAGRNPRPIATHRQQFEVHCWGADYDAAETLVLKTEAAIFLVLHGSVTFTKGTWTKPAWSKLGIVAKPTFLIDMPITAAPLTSVEITSVAHSSGLAESAESGCSPP